MDQAKRMKHLGITVFALGIDCQFKSTDIDYIRLKVFQFIVKKRTQLKYSNYEFMFK